MGERLGTISHSYVYVFKIGNVEQKLCCYSSQCLTQPSAQSSVLGTPKVDAWLKLNYPRFLILRLKGKYELSRAAPWDHRIRLWMDTRHLFSLHSHSRCTLVFSRGAAMGLTAWVKPTPHLGSAGPALTQRSLCKMQGCDWAEAGMWQQRWSQTWAFI